MYLTGATNDRDEPDLVARGVGLMAQPGNSYHLRVERYPFYGADNGCFADRWNEDQWLAWLEGLPVDRCLFAVAPDVYADAAATIARSAVYFGLIRSLGFPVALVAQDGAERLELPWDDFDALFLGGKRTDRPADEWKLSVAAETLARRARAHGKWVHMGRVNSLDRMRRARAMGCLSVDGTFVKYRRRKRATDPDGARDRRGASEVIGWVGFLDDHRPLPLWPAETPAHPVHRAAVLQRRS